MKNIKIAVFALTTALAVSPLAFAGPIAGTFSLTGTPGVFDLTGSYSTTGGINTIVTDGGTFSQTGTTSPDTTGATYSVVDPTHTSFMGSGVKNDNTFVNTVNPFSADGLLIKITSGALDNDYVYINGINGLDTGQIDVSVFTSLSSTKAISTVNYYVTNNDIPKTPEPSSMLLLGTGLLSLAGLVFWKSKSSGSSLPALTL
jgi:hypothetical protein